MKERRKNVQKFTLLSDELKMEEANDVGVIPGGVAVSSGDEGVLDDFSQENKKSGESTRSLESRVSPVQTAKPHKLSASRSNPMKKRTMKDKQTQEAVIIPRRRKSRQLPCRTNSRGNNVLLAVELNPEFHKPGSRASRLHTPPTKERVLVSQEEKEQEPPDETTTNNVLHDVDANRDRLFGGEPEAKDRPRVKTSRRRRRPKPGDNSGQNVCWWIGTNEDEEPLPPKPRHSRLMTAPPISEIKQIFNGEPDRESPTAQRRLSYKLREEDSTIKLFGSPEVKTTVIKSRPGDESQKRIFGSDSSDLPSRPSSLASSSGLSLSTRDRLFGDGSPTISPRPMSKHFPDKTNRVNIFATESPRNTCKGKSQSSIKQSVGRNPINGEGMQSARVAREPACQSSNPITGEGYRPGKRDIHAVTCRL